MGPSKVQDARVARKGPSREGARGAAVGDVEWDWRVCGSVFDGEYRGECVGQWGRAFSCFVYWKTTGGDPINGWTTGAGV